MPPRTMQRVWRLGARAAGTTQEPGEALVLLVNWRQSSSVHSACVQNGAVCAQPSASCPRGRAQAPGLPHKLLVCYEALPSLQSPP